MTDSVPAHDVSSASLSDVPRLFKSESLVSPSRHDHAPAGCSQCGGGIVVRSVDGRVIACVDCDMTFGEYADVPCSVVLVLAMIGEVMP